MSQAINPSQAVNEAEAILEEAMSLRSRLDGMHFPGCHVKLSYSIDGGKTLIDLGEHWIDSFTIGEDLDQNPT